MHTLFSYLQDIIKPRFYLPSIILWFFSFSYSLFSFSYFFLSSHHSLSKKYFSSNQTYFALSCVLSSCFITSLYHVQKNLWLSRPDSHITTSTSQICPRPIFLFRSLSEHWKCWLSVSLGRTITAKVFYIPAGCFKLPYWEPTNFFTTIHIKWYNIGSKIGTFICKLRTTRINTDWQNVSRKTKF